MYIFEVSIFDFQNILGFDHVRRAHLKPLFTNLRKQLIKFTKKIN
jgi:hypothetical protein